VADLEIVKANDFNLNIAKYVDTFETADHIDIDAIAEQLQSLEDDMAVTEQSIADFCSQLQIKPPFKYDR
jgi:type I restriction enzyme M protein